MKSSLLSPVEAYDALAPSYASKAEARSLYRHTIDNIVASHARGSQSLLDAGAGDGRRALEIARRLGIERIVLLEPSAGMRLRCPEALEVWPFSIQEIPDGREAFDLVTCLWHVLGHVQVAQHRVSALMRLRESLAPNGKLFLDVTHRYNAAAYGWGKTFARLVHDALVHSETNGDVTVSWQAGDRTIQTRSHVFTGSEMEALFRSAGLKPVHRWVIGYDTGAVCRLPFYGQLLYQLAST